MKLVTADSIDQRITVDEIDSSEQERLNYAIQMAFAGAEPVIVDDFNGNKLVFDIQTGSEIVKHSDSLANKVGTSNFDLVPWLIGRIYEEEAQHNQTQVSKKILDRDVAHELSHYNAAKKNHGEQLRALFRAAIYFDRSTGKYFHIGSVYVLNQMTPKQKRDILLAPEDPSSIDQYHASHIKL